jgi:UDP-hydrolysing UDP-N-acetyl-D-glucosamine 2-epimerase
MTVQTIEADGFDIVDRIAVLGTSDGPEATAEAMGRGLIGFGQRFRAERPTILVVVGDRFEMHAAALAALPFRIPVAHLHGGELTAGAFDDALRHSMTKLSHLHFVSTETARRRVLQLGEEPWRVSVSGAPSLDNLRQTRLLGRDELRARTGLQVPDRFLLMTFHPATLDAGDPTGQTRAVLDAVVSCGIATIVTMPNADPGGRAVRAAIEERAQTLPLLQRAENLGTDQYFSLMALASAMVGNSSSGIIEAASFALPVVNVGSRQDGRERPRNVIDVPATRDGVIEGLQHALSPAFKAGLKDMSNPYGDGHAADRIVECLARIDLTTRITQKHFVDAKGTR